jgi:predicted HicB family RNase H-like nuclease
LLEARGLLTHDDVVTFGRGLNTHTVIAFAAERFDEIVAKFHEAIDDYLDWCREDGVAPEVPGPMPQQVAS